MTNRSDLCLHGLLLKAGFQVSNRLVLHFAMMYMLLVICAPRLNGQTPVLTVNSPSGSGDITDFEFAGSTVLAINSSGLLMAPNGSTAGPSYSFSSLNSGGIYTDGTNLLFGDTPVLFGNSSVGFRTDNTYNIGATTGNRPANVYAANSLFAGTSGVFGWPSASSADTGLSRGAALIVDVGNGTNGNTQGFVKSAQSVIVASDFTTANTSLTAITGLSVQLPSVSGTNWSFSCDLVVSQASAVTNDLIGIQTAGTSAPTSLTAGGTVGLLMTGAITDVSSTAAQTLITFTPASGMQYPVHIGGGIVGITSSGSTLKILIANGGIGSIIRVYAGSSCWVY